MTFRSTPSGAAEYKRCLHLFAIINNNVDTGEPVLLLGSEAQEMNFAARQKYCKEAAADKPGRSMTEYKIIKRKIPLGPEKPSKK